MPGTALDNNMSASDLARFASALEASDDYRVVRRLPVIDHYAQKPADDTLIRTGIYLDTETTGFNAKGDRIIELAMLKFEFASDGRIFSLLDEYGELNDPGVSIPAEVVALTGITDEMVKGKRIDPVQVSRFIEGCAIVIAHNAAFDRHFVEAHLQGFDRLAWGCSQSQVSWRLAGFESSKLEYLSYRQGFFYDGHRAIMDCRAGIHLLAQPLPDESSAFAQLLDSARQKQVRVYAVGSPFESKDLLRQRGYRWNPGDNGEYKAWYSDVDLTKRDDELAFLESEVFNRSCANLPMKEINAFNRFSGRV